jgi:hypothetical protein
VRPKLNLAPRTLPIETIGKPEVKKAEIFGGGKPHDEAEYEVRGLRHMLRIINMCLFLSLSFCVCSGSEEEAQQRDPAGGGTCCIREHRCGECL